MDIVYFFFYYSYSKKHQRKIGNVKKHNSRMLWSAQPRKKTSLRVMQMIRSGLLVRLFTPKSLAKSHTESLRLSFFFTRTVAFPRIVIRCDEKRRIQSERRGDRSFDIRCHQSRFLLSLRGCSRERERRMVGASDGWKALAAKGSFPAEVNPTKREARGDAVMDLYTLCR